jgi:hypothetical protein
MIENSMAMPQYLSWIPMKMKWTVNPDKFGCRIPANSEDLVATLAAGAISIKAPTRDFANFMAGIKSGCVEAACYRWLMQNNGPWDELPKQFYLYEVFQLSPTELFAVLGDSPSKVSSLFRPCVQSESIYVGLA